MLRYSGIYWILRILGDQQNQWKPHDTIDAPLLNMKTYENPNYSSETPFPTKYQLQQMINTNSISSTSATHSDNQLISRLQGYTISQFCACSSSQVCWSHRPAWEKRRNTPVRPHPVRLLVHPVLHYLADVSTYQFLDWLQCWVRSSSMVCQTQFQGVASRELVTKSSMQTLKHLMAKSLVLRTSVSTRLVKHWSFGLLIHVQHCITSFGLAANSKHSFQNVCSYTHVA